MAIKQPGKRKWRSRLGWGLILVVALIAVWRFSYGLTRGQTINGVLPLLADLLFDLFPLAFALIGALIVARQPGNAIGWLMLVPAIGQMMSGFSAIILGDITAPPVEPSALDYVAILFDNGSWLLYIFPMLLVLLIFPSGHPPSRRWNWVIVLWVVLLALFFIMFVVQTPVGPQNANWKIPNLVGRLPEEIINAVALPPWLFGLILLTILCAAALIVRFRRSSWLERTQIKWVLFAAAVFALVYTLSLLTYWGAPAQNGTLLPQLTLLAFALAAFFIPISIGIAILRYRLWNIDVILRRTLIYVPLTAIVAGIFSATISITQKFFVSLTGQQSEAVTVFTTLVVVAVFDPIKSAITKFVDRHFKEGQDPVKQLLAVRDQARAVVQVLQPQVSARHILDVAVNAFGASGGAVFEEEGPGAAALYQTRAWDGAPRLAMTLNAGDGLAYVIALGARRNGADYSEADKEHLRQTLDQVGQALQLAGARAPTTDIRR